MKLEVAGIQYDNFTSASCEIRLDALSSTFTFEAVTTDQQVLPFNGGDACKIRVDGEVVLTGAIEIIDVDYDATSHVVTISGRDKTADLLDSTIDSISDIGTENLTLKALIEKVIAHLGLDLEVVDDANPDVFNSAEDLAAPEPGENAFSFIEKYSKKRQVLLTSNAEGNILITKNSGEVAAGAVQHRLSAIDNNVVKGRFTFDSTGRFNIYRVSSGLNPVALNAAGVIDLGTVVAQGGGVSDRDIRPGRQLILISDTPFSDAPCVDRAKWEADIRRARGLVYSAIVPFYRVGGSTGNLWEINKIYRIIDDYVGKNLEMLCNSITFSLDVRNGRRTALGFVGKDAYKLFLETPIDAEVVA